MSGRRPSDITEATDNEERPATCMYSAPLHAGIGQARDRTSSELLPSGAQSAVHALASPEMILPSSSSSTSNVDSTSSATTLMLDGCSTGPHVSANEKGASAGAISSADSYKSDDTNTDDRVRNATTASAFVTFLKALFGVSLLFQPRVLGETGLVLGTVVHIVIMACCAMSCYLLLMARHHAIDAMQVRILKEEWGIVDPPKHRSRHRNDDSFFFGSRDRFCTYGDLARQVLGKTAAIVITFTVFTLHVLFASGMVASATRNIIVLAGWIANEDERMQQWQNGNHGDDYNRDRFLEEEDYGGDEEYSDDAYQTYTGTGTASRLALTILLFPIILKLLLIRSLPGMFLVSAIGLIAYFVGCVGTMVYSAMTFSEWDGGLDAPEDLWEWKWEGIPAYVASTVYAIEGIQLALPTANHMEDSKKTVPVVSGAVFLYGLLTLSIAWIGYIGGLGGGIGTRHGENGCTYISYCLSSDFLTIVYEFSLSLALLLTLPVILYPSTEMMEMWVEEREVAKREGRLPKKGGWKSFFFESYWFDSLLNMGAAFKAKLSSSNASGGEGNDSAGKEATGVYIDMGGKIIAEERRKSQTSTSNRRSQNILQHQRSGSTSSLPMHEYSHTQNSDEGGSLPVSRSPRQQKSYLNDLMTAHFWPRFWLAVAVSTTAALEQKLYSHIAFSRGVLLSFAGFILPPILYFFSMRAAKKKVKPFMLFLLVGLVLFGLFTMVLAFIPHFAGEQRGSYDLDEAYYEHDHDERNSRD